MVRTIVPFFANDVCGVLFFVAPPPLQYLYHMPTSVREDTMKVMMLRAIGIAVFVLSAATAAEEKKTDFTNLAVGTWEVVKTHDIGPPKGGVVEFTKDGKIKVTGEQD